MDECPQTGQLQLHFKGRAWQGFRQFLAELSALLAGLESVDAQKAGHYNEVIMLATLFETLTILRAT